MEPQDYEKVCIGMLLHYGADAAQVLLPYLTPDKFIFGVDGAFGPDHSAIWQVIRNIHLGERLPLSPFVVGQRLPALADYLTKLAGDLISVYHVHSLDQNFVDRIGSRVDAQGTVYQFGEISSDLAFTVDDMKRFSAYMKKIDDIEEWAAEIVGKYSNIMSISTRLGYRHISGAVADAQEKWKRIRSGEQMLMINSGMPTLRTANLFPLGEMAVIHGESGSGKTTFALQTLLGTAIGIKQQNLQGCVAVNSLEMTEESLVTRMAGILARVNVAKLKRNTITDSEYTRLMEWSDYVKTLPIYIDSETGISTTTLQYRASGLHIIHGPIIQLMSDYVELFGNEGDTEELRVAGVARQHFNMAHRLGTSVLIISQSTVSDQKTHIAGVNGTRHSRGPRQAADIVCEMYNPVQIIASGSQVAPPDGLDPYHAWLLIQKYRGDAIGINLKFGWVPEHTTFFDPLILEQSPGNEVWCEHLEQGGW